MSLTQLLDHLQTGDVIIVREAAVRMQLPATLARPDAVDVNEIKRHKLVRSLIAVRKDGGKK